MNCVKTSPGDSSTQMEGISINDLPLEVLAHIVSFLSPSERRKSTLISRRFAEAFNASFINDVWLKVTRNPADEAEAVICKSNRQYKNVRLCRVYPLKFNSVIWTKLGMSLRKLEVINCWYLSSRKIYSILLACPRLESLAFHGSCRAFKGQHFELPSEMNLRDIQEATRNLRHLHLAFLVNTNTLERMLVAMPNLLSIAIDLFPFKYEPKSLTRLPEIMGESRGIRTADWKHDIDIETKMGQFLRIASTSLQEFRAQLFCSRIPARKEGEKLKLCTTLCHLEIGLDETMDNLLLEHILRNTPDLEVLKLFERCGLTIRLTHEVIVPILELTKLRELRLDLTLKQRPHSRVSKDFVRDLGKLSSLESLHLSQGFGTVDHSGFQSLANLPNLRELSLENLRWDDKCFEAFLSGFESLRRLSIDTNILSRNFGVPRRSESEQNIIDSAIHSESHRSGKKIKSSCLEYLELTVMPLTDVDLTRIVSHHGQLKVLKLWGCNNITDAGLVNLLQQEPLLKELCVGFWDSTDGSFFEALRELCPRLRHIHLWRCARIDLPAVKLFESRRPLVSVKFE